MPLHVVETNVRELSDPLVPWEAYSASPLVAVALFFEPLFERVLIASDNDHETQDPDRLRPHGRPALEHREPGDRR